MTYPGDSKLSEEIRQRVESTFAQSRQLASQGKVLEATLGCEFILKLDPLFEPARELLRQLESGGAAGGAGAEEAASEPAGGRDADSAAAPGADLGTDLGADLGVDLGTDLGLDGLDEPDEPAVDLSREFEDLLERRDFRTLLGLAEDNSGRVGADPGLRGMVAAATERLEAEPYVRSFLAAAEKAQREGRSADAATAIEKARALDPSHPGLPRTLQAREVDEPNERIAELLAEGQQALERGKYQDAIDSWSRIFLIDIDHVEANSRIQEARRLKAESQRQLEEAFHEGVSLWELGTTDKAREQFEKVLAIDPSHLRAQDYLRRMDAAEVAAAPAGTPSGAPSGAMDTASGDVEVFAPPDLEPPSEDLEPAPAPPSRPAGGGERRRAAGPAAAPRLGRQLLANRRFLALASLGVLVLAAVFGWLYLKRDDLFPNSDAAAPVAQVDALERARRLHAAGRTAMALTQLEQLPSDHPQYAEAQGLIAQWRAPVEEEPNEPAGPTAADLARRDELVSRGHEARQGREYLRAEEYYARAEQIAPLAEEDRLLRTEVGQRLAGLEAQIELFRQGDWEFVLPDLWQLHAANPEDKDVVRLMVDSYFNLGVRDLQRGDAPAAAAKLERAVELDPSDAEVERLLRFSRVYSERPADLLYRIFVKYLPFR
ncbi:MAG: hypothetical protein OES32_16020 [Acidobacteriota bacterium]|nr:hypothetical protein [Acidobacteriota bacterium]MDH3525083.1 hypothetical protein [Acidobacteriota bacterium]